jgi:hypothetical protein
VLVLVGLDDHRGGGDAALHGVLQVAEPVQRVRVVDLRLVF